MDRGTKIYTIVLSLIVIILAVVFLYEAPKVRRLNHQLEAINDIKNFPFPFKVLRVDNGVATLNSPVSTELPCGKIIGIIFPPAKGKSMLSPEYQKAKNLLADVQMRVGDFVKSDPDIHKIIWQLDRSWLIQNGVSLNNL
jgi:hypothetical protein